MKTIFLLSVLLTSFFIHGHDAMCSSLKELGAGRSFAFFDIDFEQIEPFIDLEINATTSYENFGDWARLQVELPFFLREIGDNDEDAIEKGVESIIYLVQSVVEALNKETAWVVLRASTPNHAFDLPRWHIDGGYYRPLNANPPKCVVTLKGDHTLFYHADKDKRQLLLNNPNNREYLADLFPLDEARIPKEGQGAFFFVGRASDAAIHSEPKIAHPRLFMAVLAGSCSEIQELQERWDRSGAS